MSALRDLAPGAGAAGRRALFADRMPGHAGSGHSLIPQDEVARRIRPGRAMIPPGRPILRQVSGATA